MSAARAPWRVLWGPTLAPLAAIALAILTGPTWTAVTLLAMFAVAGVVADALDREHLRLARLALSEAQASEAMVRQAAERALGNCTAVRPERTLTGDLVLHVIPAGTAVDLQPGVEVWHVHTGREDVAKVGRS